MLTGSLSGARSCFSRRAIDPKDIRRERSPTVTLEKIRALFLAMTKTELIIQLAKIAIGVAFGAYFLWWSVEVLHRLPPH